MFHPCIRQFLLLAAVLADTLSLAQFPVGKEEKKERPPLAPGEFDTIAFADFAWQVALGRNQGPTSPYFTNEARLAVADSLLKVAREQGYYNGQISAMGIIGNATEDVERKKTAYMRIAHLAEEHNDKRQMGWAYCVLAGYAPLGPDTCERYLRIGVEYLRQSPDTNWFPTYYGTYLELLSNRNDLYALYRESQAYLKEPRIASRPDLKLVGYNKLRHVFHALEEPDSMRYYLDRMQATYDSMPQNGYRYGHFYLLIDAYLESGTDNAKAIAMGQRRLAVDIPEYCLERWNSGGMDTTMAYSGDVKHHDVEEEMAADWYLGHLFMNEHAYDSAVFHLRRLFDMGRTRGREAEVVHYLGVAEYENGDPLSAREHLERGQELSATLGSNADRALINQYLFKLDSADGRWKDAAIHLQRFQAFTDSVSKEQHQVDLRSHLFDLRLKDEQQKAEVERLKVQAEADRQRALRNIGFGVAAVVLLLLGFIWRQRNRISKEKQRSEELLLNILPYEVAEELKAKGAAEAVQIDHVTVLFTDFKGFTAMSEQLSPKELVRDLNECFSAFDHIMSKHGIEKIKTIGDAYMAAGGLPTPNTTHALDVVKAAFEIKEFIAEGKARKIASGLPYFEIRIGIHTGPVVAGIVGVKKFAYDIWGDTVNTASRMESSGEVGQVNISESTYTLIAGEPGLVFTLRGKVRAKGKGDMEMYFVSEG